MKAPTVETFNAAEVRLELSESSIIIRDYVKALETACEGWKDVAGTAMAKIHEMAITIEGMQPQDGCNRSDDHNGMRSMLWNYCPECGVRL